jgi:hypothetical protein
VGAAAIDASIVAASVQLSKDGKVIRVHPIRHDRSRELGAFANPRAAPAARTPPSAMSPGYRNPDGDPGTELDTAAENLVQARQASGRILMLSQAFSRELRGKTPVVKRSG